MKRLVNLIIYTALFLAVGFGGYLLLKALGDARIETPSPSYVLLDRNGRSLAQIHMQQDGGYGYWPLEKLPPRPSAAAIALEDGRFWYHPGVDLLAILRAAWQNATSGKRISGASTIAMQVARLQRPGPRTYLRKIREALTALCLTWRYGREKILKHYLTIVPYGNNGHGICYAARLYLNKPVRDLSWAEIAFLSAIPQAPTLMNPYEPLGRWRCRARGQQILKALYQKKVLTRIEWELASAQIERLTVLPPFQRTENQLHAILYLKHLLKKNGAPSPVDPIFTTLDIRLQDTVAQMATSAMSRWKVRGADQVAVLVVQQPRMEVLAFIGSGGYWHSPAGAINFGTVKRSSGSTLKPFIYALALEKGLITPGTIMDDLPDGVSGTRNADDQYLGPILPRRALANSRNIPAMKLVREIGLETTFLFLKMLGLHDDPELASYYGLGIAIGSLPVDLLALSRAYTVLASGGLAKDLIWFKCHQTRIPERLLSEAHARLITLFLSDPMARLPSFPRMGTTEYPFPVALKTGTSQGFRDAWTIAYSKAYLVAVWTGRADHQPMHKLSGSGSAAALAKNILLHLHPRQNAGGDDLAFPAPQGFQPVELCAETGKENQGLCERTQTEWLKPDQIPAKDQAHKRLTIDRRNGCLAGPWTPVAHRKSAFFIELPPKYRKWARVNAICAPPKTYSLLDMPANLAQVERVLPPNADVLKGLEPVALAILSPDDGLKIRSNINIPADMNSIGLKVETQPPIEEVLWFVDGKPYKLGHFWEDLRWPLVKGKHWFQVKLPYREEVSPIVRIEVQ